MFLKKFLFNSLFLVAAAGVGLANNIPNVTMPALPAGIPTGGADPITLLGELSPQCVSAFLGIVANPEFFQCVPVGALLPVLIDPTFLPSVMNDPIANGAKLLPVVEAICSVPKCSDEGVAGALKAVQEGCSSESDAKNPITQLALGVLTFYSPVRDIICFKDNKDQLCVVDLVTTILTLPAPPERLLDGGLLDKFILNKPSFFCTPCNKAIVNTIINFFKDHPEAVQMLEAAFKIGQEELLLGKFGIAVKCGFQFEDGKVPKTTIDPSKFSYQVANGTDKPNDAAILRQFSLVTGCSLLASTVLLI